MTTAFLTCRQRLRSAIRDGRREVLTTALTTSTNVVSTHLRKWDGGTDNAFPDWFVYVEDYANAGESRVRSGYTTSSGTVAVRGASFSSDSANLATVMLTVYDPDDYKEAIERAIRRLHLKLWVPLDNTELTTGNILPPFNWSSTSALNLYTDPTGTLLKNTDATYYWRGATSAKVTASGANDYLYIDSSDYPRLLDLMGQTITYRDWVYPEVADDAFLTIAWTESDGSTDSADSTTTCPAGLFTLLEIENQAIPDDIRQIQFRMRVETSAKYVYFSPPRATGLSIRELLLPGDFQGGHVSRVNIQVGGEVDDLRLRNSERVYNINVINDGTYDYLWMPAFYGDNKILQLIGEKPLTVPSSDSASVEVDDPQLELLIAMAASELFKILRGPVSTQDTDKFAEEIAYWDREVFRMTPQYKMTKTASTVRFRA